LWEKIIKKGRITVPVVPVRVSAENLLGLPEILLLSMEVRLVDYLVDVDVLLEELVEAIGGADVSQFLMVSIKQSWLPEGRNVAVTSPGSCHHHCPAASPPPPSAGPSSSAVSQRFLLSLMANLFLLLVVALNRSSLESRCPTSPLC
jgi:hypothetical protein